VTADDLKGLGDAFARSAREFDLLFSKLLAAARRRRGL
jgi:hypothetical protein